MVLAILAENAVLWSLQKPVKKLEKYASKYVLIWLRIILIDFLNMWQ